MDGMQPPLRAGHDSNTELSACIRTAIDLSTLALGFSTLFGSVVVTCLLESIHHLVHLGSHEVQWYIHTVLVYSRQ